MNVVMTHPDHGAKIAISDIEIKQDEKNGWVRYNADTPAQAATPVEETSVKRRQFRKVAQPTIEQPNEVPDFLTSVSDESEGS